MRLTGMRLGLHAPGDLLTGSRRDDAQLEGALRYAELARTDLLVLHAGRSATSPAPDRPRLDAEERSLRGLARGAADRGVRLAIENSAPCYAGHECLCHDPAAVAALVRRLGCAEVGMCLDIGHAHIAADRAGRDLAELIEPLLDVVILFGIHDNFGARSGAQRAGGIEAMRLDLHLAPGAGTVPWTSLVPLLAPHSAPLVLEVHPAQRPVPTTVAVITRELIGLGAPPALGAHPLTAASGVLGAPEVLGA